MRTCRTLFVISIFVAILTCAANGGTIYVDASATGANNGSSWGNAYIYLQDALAAAISGDNIWVAQGTYKPDQGVGKTPGDRMATFDLKDGVSIYGGFPIGGVTWEERDPDSYETILSGDLNGDDEPNFVNNGENSYIICRIDWLPGKTVLDGFTIKGATGTGTAGGVGLYNRGGQMAVVNCKFLNNYSNVTAAIRFYNPNGIGTLTGFEITDCLFQNNSGREVVYMRGSSPVFRNCLFKQNTATSSMIQCSSRVGSPEPEIYSNPTFINVALIGNSANNYHNGVMRIDGECTSLLINCVLAANSDPAICALGMSGFGMTTLVNCTIVGNGEIGIYGKPPISAPIYLTNCIIWGNSLVGITAVTSSCIQDADPNDSDIPFGGVANHNIDDNPRFMRDPSPGADGVWGTADDDYGDLRLQHTSPCIDSADNASLPADTTDLDGDGNTTEPIPYDLDGHPRIVDGDCNSTSVVDMGAYEFSYIYLGDFAGGCNVDFADLEVLAEQWLQPPGTPSADIAPQPNGDGIVNFLDFAILASHWLEGI